MSRHATKTSFKKGTKPWWEEKSVPHPMKNCITSKKQGETLKRLYKEGKIIAIVPKCRKEKNGKWKGGRYTKQGYEYINVDGKVKLFHRHVVEQTIGRPLCKGETVHHLDGNKHNCKIENLLLCKNQSEHTKIHQKMEDLVYQLIKEGKIVWDSATKEFQLCHT